MNGAHAAIIAKRTEYICTGLVVTITLDFCVILIYYSETTNWLFQPEENIS